MFHHYVARPAALYLNTMFLDLVLSKNKKSDTVKKSSLNSFTAPPLHLPALTFKTSIIAVSPSSISQQENTLSSISALLKPLFDIVEGDSVEFTCSVSLASGVYITIKDGWLMTCFNIPGTPEDTLNQLRGKDRDAYLQQIKDMYNDPAEKYVLDRGHCHPFLNECGTTENTAPWATCRDVHEPTYGK